MGQFWAQTTLCVRRSSWATSRRRRRRCCRRRRRRRTRRAPTCRARTPTPPSWRCACAWPRRSCSCPRAAPRAARCCSTSAAWRCATASSTCPSRYSADTVYHTLPYFCFRPVWVARARLRHKMKSFTSIKYGCTHLTKVNGNKNINVYYILNYCRPSTVN